jgi:hypothetical protein
MLIALTAFALSTALLVMWPWSYRRQYGCEVHPGGGRAIAVVTYRGSIVLVVGPPAGHTWGIAWYDEPTVPKPSLHTFINFLWVSIPAGTAIGVPLWACAIPFAYLGRRYLRLSQQPSPGHCPQCGYDLRATPDRCPECGTLAPAKS